MRIRSREVGILKQRKEVRNRPSLFVCEHRAYLSFQMAKNVDKCYDIVARYRAAKDWKMYSKMYIDQFTSAFGYHPSKRWH